MAPQAPPRAPKAAPRASQERSNVAKSESPTASKPHARPKSGFSVPISDWLRGPLKEWADNLINPERIRKEGYFDSQILDKRWKEHLSGNKNWSSFILYNCAHPSTKSLTVEKVNSETGAYLHQFKWCKNEEIGSLDERWNWLEGWTSGHNNQKPFAVHYTRGGPWFSEWQDVEYAKEWLEERDDYLSKKFNR